MDMKMNETGDYYKVVESYKLIREKIVHEDDLVNQRATWLIAFNGLIFSAYGFSLMAEASSLIAIGNIENIVVDGHSGIAEKIFNPEVENFKEALASLRAGLIATGLGSSVAAFASINAAFRRISKERENFYKYMRPIRQSTIKNFELREKIGWIPRVTGFRTTNIFGMFGGFALPILIGGAWSWIGRDWISSVFYKLLADFDEIRMLGNVTTDHLFSILVASVAGLIILLIIYAVYAIVGSLGVKIYDLPEVEEIERNIA